LGNFEHNIARKGIDVLERTHLSAPPLTGNRQSAMPRRRLAGNVGSCVMFIGVTNKRQTDAATLHHWLEPSDVPDVGAFSATKTLTGAEQWYGSSFYYPPRQSA
jgi:hypothetical protein